VSYVSWFRAPGPFAERREMSPAAGAAVLAGGRTADQRCAGAKEEGLAGRGGERLRPDSGVDAITVAGSRDAAGIDKLCQDFGDVAAAHAGGVAQLAL